MKERLIESAKALGAPSPGAAKEFAEKREQLAEMGSATLASRGDVKKLVGENLEMAQDNNRNFARFMESMFMSYDATVLVETVLWVFRAYRSHGFQTTYWPANINIWIDNLKSELTEETFEALYPHYDWLIVNIPIFAKLTDEAVVEQVPLTGRGTPAHG